MAWHERHSATSIHSMFRASPFYVFVVLPPDALLCLSDRCTV
jgi:hypothetical protein